MIGAYIDDRFSDHLQNIFRNLIVGCFDFFRCHPDVSGIDFGAVELFRIVKYGGIPVFFYMAHNSIHGFRVLPVIIRAPFQQIVQKSFNGILGQFNFFHIHLSGLLF